MQKVGYKTLLIVESPSKCKTIEKILGPAYMCVATCGHIRDLAIRADLSNLPEVISSSWYYGDTFLFYFLNPINESYSDLGRKPFSSGVR